MQSIRRRACGAVLALLIALSYFTPVQQALRSLPQTIALTEGQTHVLTLPSQLHLMEEGGNRAVSSSQDETLLGRVSVQADEAGEASLSVSLLGILPLKRVAVDVSPEKRLIPGGMTIGVAMRTSGVLLVGTGNVCEEGSPAANCGLRAGDVLLEVNGVEVTSSEQLTTIIAGAGNVPMPVKYLRDGVRMQTMLTPWKDQATGKVHMGAWVRDSTAGIGTLSFYDAESGRYAALGHAITDGDTGQVLSVSEGQILSADVVAVQQGKKGVPGELKGSFLQKKRALGTIGRNTVLGVYGTLDVQPGSSLYPDGLPVGLRSGVHTGAASILSTVDASGVQEFSVEITRVNRQDKPAAKSMTLRVTDERLLKATGGIVQGMSGSPILQDGRIIGAVTHVFVNDPTQGYGVYIDWMLGEAGQT